jgi:pimeloyl-ACP methyl ester carboxylesterase
MKISYKELQVNDYTIRGLFTEPDNGYTDIAVMLHGYTGHKNENGFLFKQITKTLVECGIATLRFDYYGSGDSDGEFHEQNFTTVRNDAKAVIDEAVKLNNGKQIYLIGFSMGGACAARMSVERKDSIKKLVLMSPAGSMYDILDFIFKKNPVIDENFVDIGGYYVGKGFLESFKDFNMYEGLELFDKPVLITQGSEDLSVYPHVSKKYTEYYKDSKYVLIEGATHCYTKVPYRKQVNEEIKNFLTK